MALHSSFDLAMYICGISVSNDFTSSIDLVTYIDCISGNTFACFLLQTGRAMASEGLGMSVSILLLSSLSRKGYQYRMGQARIARIIEHQEEYFVCNQSKHAVWEVMMWSG